MTSDHPAPRDVDDVERLLDQLVGEYSDRIARGERPDRSAVLARVAPEHRPALERSLRMIDVGLAKVPGAPQPLAAGTIVDGYRLVRELGRGGMATVWLAEQVDLERPVALKLLRPALALEQRHIDRFRREALAVARLNHPHIVKVHAVGAARGYPYIAMEYVEGATLAQVLQRLPAARPWKPRDLAEAAGIPQLALRGDTYEACIASLLSEVAAAIVAAHEVGIIHRDVKPSNILLRRGGEAVVADFGLAKADTDPALSMTGDTIGTPWYMSPEQALTIEARVDRRTDVYSLGVTLYEALAGQRPFDGKTALAVLEAIKSAVPKPLRQVSEECSPNGEAVVRRAMARYPDDRYPGPTELQQDLVRLARGETTRARVDEGGPVRRALTTVRYASVGGHGSGRYRSAGTFLGLPLYDICVGQRAPGEPMRVAKGWLAIGDVAVGGIALGGMSIGLLASGGAAVGLLAGFGGVVLGGLAFGGVALGGVTIGGLSMGWLAFGGLALGYYAIGGKSIGAYATGGSPTGDPIVWGEGGTFSDLWIVHAWDTVVQFFEGLFPAAGG